MTVTVTRTEGQAQRVEAIHVELRRMYIAKQTPFGVVKQDTQQYEVLVGVDQHEPQRVAYVCDHAGAPVNFLSPDVPEEIKQAVLLAIAGELGEGVRKVSAPPAIPVEVDDAEDDNDYTDALYEDQ